MPVTHVGFKLIPGGFFTQEPGAGCAEVARIVCTSHS